MKNKSEVSETSKFLVVAAITLVLVAISALLWAPVLVQSYHQGVDRVISRGDSQSDPKTALAYYQAADAVSAASVSLVGKEASAYAKLEDYNQAAAEWGRLPLAQGGLDQARALLQADRPDDAAKIASQLDKTAEVQNLLAKIRLEQGTTQSDSQAAGVVLGLSISNSASPQTLYNLGLLRAPQRLLETATIRTAADNRLLATIYVRRANFASASDRKDFLHKAAASLQSSLLQDVTSLPAHQLLRDVDTSLGDNAGAQNQVNLISQLQSGKL